MGKRFLFTSESVSAGHPDKVADQISDAILDEYLKHDPMSKVACETMVTHKGIVLAGEIHSRVKLQDRIPDLVREVIRSIGYDIKSEYDPNKIWIKNYLHEQSSEIRNGVESGGAGDQGLMFGYACNETKSFMPLAIDLANKILIKLNDFRISGKVPWLLPDAKSQVTIRYEDGIPVGIDNIIVSTQHMPFYNRELSVWEKGNFPFRRGHYEGLTTITQEMIRETVINSVINPTIPERYFSDKINYMINPAGSFTIGGPIADTGLTGRKIIVDTYGGSCPHGGGAFSGKDGSKVDRSAAYAARYIAKNIVGAGISEKAQVQIAYAIGLAEPVSFNIDTLGTSLLKNVSGNIISDDIITKKIQPLFDLRPISIINQFGLRYPIFRDTASYGHFGRPTNMKDVDLYYSESGPQSSAVLGKVEFFPWEKLDKIEVIQELFNINN